MAYFDTILLALGVVGAGWIVGRLIHNFVDFAVELIKKQEDNKED